MKKFRIVAILLVMCLASSCFVGSTFAKYSSTVSASDSAVVAKWKISYNPDSDNKDITREDITFDLFNTIKDTDGTSDETNVNSNLIAPGTEGTFSFTLENVSDVDASFNININEDILNNSENLTSPIQYTVEVTGSVDGGGTGGIGDNCVTDANFSRSEEVTVTVKWVWPIGGDEEYNDWGIAAQSGNLGIKITAEIIVTQVD